MDLKHRAALLRVVCLAWVPGSSLPPCSSPPHSLLLSPLSTLPLSLCGWSICSESQSNLIHCWPVCSPYIAPTLLAWVNDKWQFGGFGGFVTLKSRVVEEKMKSSQRYPISSSCHCSGVARSDSKISAKALYGKWLHGGSVLFQLVFQTLPLHVLQM